ncbi:MarR family transcriptional regulator [Ancylobacter sp. MQZ15Z-1]|uniref:MarR family transcriptional regulator n=1 Tax=Ancylobacter mangrovi TaxID=2972472 RepID=A0A9X2PJA0_9HYPH|nr:MarR family transcriptional regulator [Ancylobacter mangrovi]MCS0496172.1 MarR family transcriptional regulator [Ancylobacter mangrovi]
MPQDDVLTVIHEVAHLMRIRFDQRARAYGMTRAQWVILLKLRRGPAPTQNELASMIEVEPITVARLVDRLEARGFVERRHDPNDRRAWRLHLLPAAGPIIDDIAVVRAEVLAQLLGDTVDEKEVAAVDATLRKMKSNLQSADGRTSAAAP